MASKKKNLSPKQLVRVQEAARRAKEAARRKAAGRRVLALIVLAAYVVAGGAVAVAFLSIHLTPYGSIHGANATVEPAIGVVARGPESLTTANFSDRNPSLDLAIGRDESLVGYFRVSLISIDQPEEEAQIGLVLPARAAVIIGDTTAGVAITTESGAAGGGRFTCDLDAYGEGEVGDARGIVELRSATTDEKWSIECEADRMTVWYHLPAKREDGELYQRLEGAHIATWGVAMVYFEIPNYVGLQRTSFASFELALSVECLGRGNSVPLGYALSASIEDSIAGSVSVNATDPDVELSNLSPDSFIWAPKTFYKAENAPTWAAAFNANAEYYSASATNLGLQRLESTIDTIFWVFVALILPVGAAFAVTAVRRRGSSDQEE